MAVTPSNTQLQPTPAVDGRKAPKASTLPVDNSVDGLGKSTVKPENPGLNASVQ
jgi:hypothetical protein